MCVPPHPPDAASGLALRLIGHLLWMAVKALIMPRHFPLHHIGLPESHVKVLQG